MSSQYYDDLNIFLYPSRLLHSYGVNGKISGSVGAIGEMSEDVIAIRKNSAVRFAYNGYEHYAPDSMWKAEKYAGSFQS